MNIKRVPNFTNYKNQKSQKTQIYLHHTAGGANGQQQFQFWQADPRAIATCVCVSRDGTIDQGYGSEYWAYHLGLATKHFGGRRYINLDMISIGVEICSWGWLTKKGDEYFTYVGSKLPADRVITLDKPYKGQIHWEAYTEAQIESVRALLVHWHKRYNIPITYNEASMWGVSDAALTGKPGLYTHNSVRADKSDIYPDPRLINMLQSL